jgi:sugar phosphate isomerase/epimerase
LGISAYAPDFAAVPPAEVEALAYLEVIQKSLLFCNRLEIGRLRVDSVSSPRSLPSGEYEHHFGHLALTWRKAAEVCRQAGVLLVWEFEPGFWLNKPSEVRRMVEAVDHPNFKLLFDTSHAYMGSVFGSRHTGMPEALKGGVVEYAHLLRPYLGHLHLIDSDGTLHDGATSTHYPFGEGKVDFAGTLNALRPELDQLNWWCVDYCFWPNGEVDAEKAVPFVRNLANEVFKNR